MKKYLITGFEPFAEFKTNPSAEFIRSLTDEHLEGKVLPVDYVQLKKEIAEIAFSDYEFIFMFGLAADRKEISFERVALNWIESAAADNSGVRPQPQKIDNKLGDAIINPLPLDKWIQDLKLTADVKISHTAGAYLCNFLYFQVLQKHKNSLFIHIPSQVSLLELKRVLDRLILLQAPRN